MTDKKIRTKKSTQPLYLSDDNLDWMRQNKLNMSAFVNELITRVRKRVPRILLPETVPEEVG